MLRKTLVIALLLLALCGAAAAQDAAVEIIAVPSQQFNYALSPDGRLAATFELSVIHEDMVLPEFLPIRLYDLESGEEVLALSGYTDYAADVVFSPDGSRLASYHQNGYVNIWEMPSGSLLKTIPAITGFARVRFLPDNRTLAVMVEGVPTPIMLWDTETGAISTILVTRYNTLAEWRAVEFDRLSGPDRAIVFEVAPDGGSFISATMVGHVWLWDPATGLSRQLVMSEDDLPTFGIRQLDITADSAVVGFLNSQQNQFFLLDARTGEELAAIPVTERSRAGALSPDGQLIAWTNGDSVFTAPASQPEDVTEYPLGLGTRARGTFILEFTPDSAALVFGGLWNETGENALFVIDLGG